ncbi:MAG: hypothetical protein JW769_02615 [Parachlamydiales bacterium]|nr:hypothetical protein [Parachlamydiales bacterium]
MAVINPPLDFSQLTVLHPARSVSSHAISRLNYWRNPDHEIAFNDTGRSFLLLIHCESYLFRLKMLISQCAYAALGIFSTTELIAYSALTLLSLTLYPITDRPFQRGKELLSSSGIVILWSINNMVFNFFTENFIVFEATARVKYEIAFNMMIIGTLTIVFIMANIIPPKIRPLSYMRLQDHNFNYRLMRPMTHQEIPGQLGALLRENFRSHEKIVQSGTDFMLSIIQKYQKDTDHSVDINEESFLDHFEMIDALAIKWILTASLWTLSHSSCSIPPTFLKPNVQRKLQQLRMDGEFQSHLLQIQSNPIQQEQLLEIFQKTLKDFDLLNIDEIEDPSIQFVFRKIVPITNDEEQESTYITTCWGDAINFLIPPEN